MVIRGMKITVLLAVSFCIMTSSLHAFDKWDTTDYSLEAAWFVFHFIDWNQTVQGTSEENFTQINPVLGKHPTRQKVNIWFGLSSLIHIGGTHIAPEHFEVFGFDLRPRRTWQCSTITVSSSMSLHNYQVGLRVRY